MKKNKFTYIFDDVTKQGTKIPTNRYLAKGLYPIIDQGHSQIAGYANEQHGLFTDVPAIIFGDHTRIIKYVDTPCFLGADGVKLLKAKDDNANYKYLYYTLCNADIPNTGYNRHFKWLKEIDIPEYSMEEQNSIVSQLEKIDVLISLRKQQRSKLDELVKSRFIEMFGGIKDDEKVTLSDICLIITDGTHQPPKFTTTGIPFLFVSNIVGNTITYDAEKFISEETYAELIKRTPIEIGDVLLSTVGSYGHPAVVKSDKPFCFQRHIAYLKPNKELIDSEYLHGAMLSVDVQKQIEERVKGIAQKTLNLSEIRKIKLPLPTMDKQKQFAAFVEQVDKSKFEIQKSLEKLETLKKALMQKYFG